MVEIQTKNIIGRCVRYQAGDPTRWPHFEAALSRWPCRPHFSEMGILIDVRKTI